MNRLPRPGEEKHLRAYRVTIDPETEHKGVEYHHEGEEFRLMFLSWRPHDSSGFKHFNLEERGMYQL